MIAPRTSAPPHTALLGALLVGALLGACSGRIGEQASVTPGGGGGGGPGPSASCARPTPPLTPRLPRLSFAQYDASVRALTGLDVTPSTELGPEVEGVTPVLWAGLRVAAEDVARRAIADPSARARLIRCAPAGTAPRARATPSRSSGAARTAARSPRSSRRGIKRSGTTARR